MENRNILVVAEQRNGEMQNVTYELLGAATRLSAVAGGLVQVLVMGKDVEKSAEALGGYGADQVIVAEAPELEYYLTEPYAEVAFKVIREQRPNVVLFGASSIGRDLAPRVSALLNTGLTADCTKLEITEDGSLYMTRPAFGGNLFATILCPDHRPQMSTVRPGVMKKNEFMAGRQCEITLSKIKPTGYGRVTLIKEVKEKSAAAPLEDAKLIVSVGRGAGKANIAAAEELASALQGTLGASRAMIDAGLLPADRQVGQTGKTVHPECYIALGISGAVQHLAGMEDSDYIIAVNKDKTASIFNVSDLGVVGDVDKILPLINEEVARIKRENN